MRWPTVFFVKPSDPEHAKCLIKTLSPKPGPLLVFLSPLISRPKRPSALLALSAEPFCALFFCSQNICRVYLLHYTNELADDWTWTSLGFAPGLKEVSDWNFYQFYHWNAGRLLLTSFAEALSRLDCFVRAKIPASFRAVLPAPIKPTNL